MTIKIITWLKTSSTQFESSNDGYFEVEPFFYNGVRVKGIEVGKANKEHYKTFMERGSSQPTNTDNQIVIELGDNESKSQHGDGYILKLNKKANIEKWSAPSELRFKLVRKTKWGHMMDYHIDLEVEDKDKVLGAEGYLTPSAAGFQINFGSNEDSCNKFLARMKEGEEYTVSNISWKGVAWIGTIPKYLNLNYHGGQPIIQSEKEKQAVSEQASNAATDRKKVDAAVTRAREARTRLFKWGWNNDNKEDFQEAVTAISELIRIANHGSKAEKEEYATMLDWKIDDDEPNSFSDLKATIQQTSINNGKGWKYDLDAGTVDWGVTEKPVKDSQDQQDKGDNDNNNDNGKGNDKKRKNEDNNDSPEPKRTKVETEVQQDLAKKDEEATNKLMNDLAGLDSNDEQKKEQALADIEKLKNDGGVYEKQKEQIKEKKDAAAQSDPQGYGKMIAKIIQQKIQEFKLEIDKLGAEIKEKLAKLQNGEFTSDTEVRQVEEEVSEVVSEEVANVEVNNLLAQAQNLINGAAGNLKSQLEKIKKDFYSFKLSTNPYQQKAYQSQKTNMEKALRDLENLSQTQQPTKGFFRPEIIIPVSLALVAILVVGALIIRKRRLAKVKN